MENSYVNDFNDTIKAYTAQLRKFNPIDRETEKVLIEKAQKGDIEAQNILIQSNLRFVMKIAKQFTGRGVALEDLISEGNLGLIKAIHKFKKQDENRLLSYGIWWIKANMQQAIKDYTDANYYELKELDNLNENKANNIIEENDENNEGNDIIAFAVEVDEHINDIHKTQKEVVDQLFKQLTDRERFIVSSYFGLESEEMTLDEIGAELNLSIERVRQCKEIAIKKMRSKILCMEDDYTHIFA